MSFDLIKSLQKKFKEKLERPMTYSEFQEALKKMRENKMPDSPLDDILSELETRAEKCKAASEEFEEGLLFASKAIQESLFRLESEDKDIANDFKRRLHKYYSIFMDKIEPMSNCIINVTNDILEEKIKLKCIDQKMDGDLSLSQGIKNVFLSLSQRIDDEKKGILRSLAQEIDQEKNAVKNDESKTGKLDETK